MNHTPSLNNNSQSLKTPLKRPFSSNVTPSQTDDDDDDDLDRPLLGPDGRINVDFASRNVTTPLLPINERNAVPTWTPRVSPEGDGGDSRYDGVGERRRNMLRVLEGDAGEGMYDFGMEWHACGSSKDVERSIVGEDEDSVEVEYDAKGAPRPFPMGRVQKWHLHHSLRALQRQLGRLGIPLVFKKSGECEAGFVEQEDVVVDYAKKIGARRVVWNRKYYPHARGVEARVKMRLRDLGIGARSFMSESLLEPELKGGVVFDKFHPYMKFWLKALDGRPPKRPVSVAEFWIPGLGFDGIMGRETDINILGLVEADVGREVEGISGDPREIGCVVAERKLENFANGRGFALFGDQSLRRDGLRTLDEIRTSKLSAHLRFGEISPRVLYHAIKDIDMHNGIDSERVKLATRAFMRNLSLREFAYHMLNRHPTATHKPILPEFSHFPWRKDSKGVLFSSWKTGNTGYPVVDAAMRQLAREGWVHNRMRFLVASFFCKYLVLPWPMGASFFVQSLVDGDEACNTLGWQWTVGCNSDSFPFSTLVNPVSFAKQSPSQVAATQYIRKYIPELRRMPTEFIFTPWQAPASVLESAGVSLYDSISSDSSRVMNDAGVYPLRVVSGAEARNRARRGMTLIRKMVCAQRPQPTLIVDQEESGRVVENLRYQCRGDEAEVYEMSECTRESGVMSTGVTTTTAGTTDMDAASGQEHNEIVSSGVPLKKKMARKRERQAQQIAKQSHMQVVTSPVLARGGSSLASSSSHLPQTSRADGSSAREPVEIFPNPLANLPRTPVLHGNGFATPGINASHQRRAPSSNGVPPYALAYAPDMRGPVYAPPSPFSSIFSPVMTGDRSPFPRDPHPASPAMGGTGYGGYLASNTQAGRIAGGVGYGEEWVGAMYGHVPYHEALHHFPGQQAPAGHPSAVPHIPLGHPPYQAQLGCPHYPSGHSADGRRCGICPVGVPLPAARRNPPGQFPSAFAATHAHSGGVASSGTIQPMIPGRVYMVDEPRVRNFPGQQAGPVHAAHGGRVSRQLGPVPLVVPGAAVAGMGFIPGAGHVPRPMAQIQAQAIPRQDDDGEVMVLGKPQTSTDRMRIAQLMAAMDYTNPLYGNKFQEQWQSISLHLLREYELTEETDRDTSRHYVRLCNLKNELIESDQHRDIRLRAKVTTSNLKEFFKILNLPVTGEWDRRGHGGTRGPYVYGLCRRGENRMPRTH